MVKITGGRFWGMYGKCTAHDGQMRIVTFMGHGNINYRVHEDHIEPVGDRAA